MDVESVLMMVRSADRWTKKRVTHKTELKRGIYKMKKEKTLKKDIFQLVRDGKKE